MISLIEIKLVYWFSSSFALADTQESGNELMQQIDAFIFSQIMNNLFYQNFSFQSVSYRLNISVSKYKQDIWQFTALQV